MMLNKFYKYLLAGCLIVLFGCSKEQQTTPANPTKILLDSAYVWHFISEPNLHLMKVQVQLNKAGVASGAVFLAPYVFDFSHLYGQYGALIVDNNGAPVYFRPLTNGFLNLNFRVQQLHGQAVLTFWEGMLANPPIVNLPAGLAEPGAKYYILDNHYRTIKTIEPQQGFIADPHEFLITPQNTALFYATKMVPMDLTSVGGPKNGFLADYSLQEIDIDTGKLVSFWDAKDHLALSDTYQPIETAAMFNNMWDVFHFNAVSTTDNPDELLLSSRNLSTIFKINKKTGAIIWRLGGKKNNFTMAKNSEFSWQHNIEFLTKDTVSLFDNDCCVNPFKVPAGTLPSRGMVLQLDMNKMTAELKYAYYNADAVHVPTQGDLQTLANGNKFIGWGQQSYYTEYKAAGNSAGNQKLNKIYSAKMPGENISYRAFRYNWMGQPDYPPALVIKAQKAYVSWNGATEVASWQLWAGKSDKLQLIATVKKSGFETAIPMTAVGSYVQVKALDAHDKVIGVSASVHYVG